MVAIIVFHSMTVQYNDSTVKIISSYEISLYITIRKREDHGCIQVLLKSIIPALQHYLSNYNQFAMKFSYHAELYYIVTTKHLMHLNTLQSTMLQ